MSSIERRVDLWRIGGVALLILTTAGASATYTPSSEAQPAELVEDAAVVTPDASVALIAASLAAYGWIVTKSYDLGKELGRREALRSIRPKGSVVLDNVEYERLLD